MFLIEHVGNLLQILVLLFSGYCIYYSRAYFQEFRILDFTNPLESLRLLTNTGNLFYAVLCLGVVAVDCFFIYKRYPNFKTRKNLTDRAEKVVGDSQEILLKIEKLENIELPDDIRKEMDTLLISPQTLAKDAGSAHTKAKELNQHLTCSTYFSLIKSLPFLISIVLAVCALFSMPKNAAEKVKVGNSNIFQIQTDSQSFRCLSLIAKNSEFYYFLEFSTSKILLIPSEKLNEISVETSCSLTPNS